MKPVYRKILIIDGQDDQLLSDTGFDGFTVTYTRSLAEATLLLKKNLYHAIVSDFFLPDGKGIDLLPLPGCIPLVIIVNTGQEDLIPLALEAGASDYLVRNTSGIFLKLLPVCIGRSIQIKQQSDELVRYKTQLENIVEERTIELIDMYSKLQESETNFRNIYNSTIDGIIIMDYNYRFIEANDAALAELGVEKEYLRLHNDILSYLVPGYKHAFLKNIELLRSGLSSGVIECEIKAPGPGRPIPFEVSSVPIVFNQQNVILHVMRNIAERRNHARKLFETIIQTEEDERARMARDLHDEIGPLISALKIYSTTFLESKNAEKKEKLATQMGSIVKDLLESIKVISNDMSSHVLSNFGLPAALENFINHFTKNITINLNTNLERYRFPSPVESLVYRIIKELLNNTIKHASATQVDIDISWTGNGIHCNYRDNGIGFDWNKQLQSPSQGMGINNIITRIKSLDGDFTINSAPNNGFEINFLLKTAFKDDANKKEKQNNYC